MPKTLLISLFLSNFVILVSFIVKVDWLAVSLLINSALGEILLPNLDATYVRGLTPNELKKLLIKRYTDFLIEPEIKLRIEVFKQIR